MTTKHQQRKTRTVTKNNYEINDNNSNENKDQKSQTKTTIRNANKTPVSDIGTQTTIAYMSTNTFLNIDIMSTKTNVSRRRHYVSKHHCV